MRSCKPFRILLAALALSGTSELGVERPAAAAAVPFTDPDQHGTLTFCNHNEQPVSSGRLTDIPFVWTAVSSTPAPAGYTLADLLVFQPIQHVDPSGWAGYQMTVAATFSNPKHPMAQATYADNPLGWANRAYPPYWDGLYEIRMYFTAPYLSEEKASYPAAVIQVSGNTWTQLTGGGGSCQTGTAVSRESFLLPKSKTETPSTFGPATSQGNSPGRGATLQVNPSGRSTGTAASHISPAGQSGTNPSLATSGHSVAAGDESKGRSALPWFIGSIGAVVVIAGVVGGWQLRRRRRQLLAG